MAALRFLSGCPAALSWGFFRGGSWGGDHFLSLTYNLMVLYENRLASSVIRNEAEEKRKLIRLKRGQ